MASSTPATFLPRLVALRATRAGRVLEAALWGSVALLVAAVVVRHARTVVHRMPIYRIGPEAVQFVDLPKDVDDRMRAELSAQVAELWPADPRQRPSTFDPAIDRRIREILVGSPTIREVADVDVRYPAEVRVHATLRVPLAQFRARWPDRQPGSPSTVVLPLDADGVVLTPSTYAGFLSRHRAVLVTGVEATCPGIGRLWSDSKEQVAEGLSAARVANRLNAEMIGLGAPRIDVADVAGFPSTPRTRMRGEVVFILSDGRVVQWGRTERDLTGVTREDGYETKRDRLLDLLATRSINDRRQIDVRSPPNLPDLRLRTVE